MLVLQRKSNESVVVGTARNLNEMVRVTVVEVRGERVKLGFQADDDVAIYREEVWERIRAENVAPEPKPIPQPPKYKVPYID